MIYNHELIKNIIPQKQNLNSKIKKEIKTHKKIQRKLIQGLKTKQNKILQTNK